MFDFMNPPSEASILEGRGGILVNAFSTDFPALVGNNMAMAVGFTKPCGWVAFHEACQKKKEVFADVDLGSIHRTPILERPNFLSS